MMLKIHLIFVLSVVAVCSAGIIRTVPAVVPGALTIGTYATSYNAHAVNHAIAAPYVATAPGVVAPLTAYPGYVSPYTTYTYAAAPYLG